MKPVISVITPNLNRAHSIAETLESLKQQSSPLWECVVVDDGSTDNSAEVVARFSADDDRIRWYKRDVAPAGAGHCRNIGVEMARGDYVMFLDSDDIAALTCIEKRIEAARAAPEADIVVFQGMTFRNIPGDEDFLWNTLNDEPLVDRFLKLDSPWQGTGPLWKREVFRNAGGWRTSLACWQDIDLSLRALTTGLKHVIRYDLPPDVYLRRGDGTTISSSGLRSPAKLASKREVFREGLAVATSNDVPANEILGRKGAARTLAFSVGRDHILGRQPAGALWVWYRALRAGVISVPDALRFSLDMTALLPVIRHTDAARRIASSLASTYGHPGTIGVQRAVR